MKASNNINVNNENTTNNSSRSAHFINHNGEVYCINTEIFTILIFETKACYKYIRNLLTNHLDYILTVEVHMDTCFYWRTYSFTYFTNKILILLTNHVKKLRNDRIRK